MKRQARDNQKARLYRAERAAFIGSPYGWDAYEIERDKIFCHTAPESVWAHGGCGHRSHMGERQPNGDVDWYWFKKRGVWAPEALRTVPECQAYVDQVERRLGLFGTGHRGWQVTPGKGARWATARSNGVINLPRWARSRPVILHEIAHHLSREPQYASHGPEFAREYVDLVRLMLGPIAARRLLDAFRAERVKVGPATESAVAACRKAR